MAGTRRAASTSNVTPTTADKTEAMNTAILAASKSASDRNASPAMKSDIVNPIPPSAAAPANCAHEYSLGFSASRVATASAEASSIPTGLPTTSPAMIAPSTAHGR